MYNENFKNKYCIGVLLASAYIQNTLEPRNNTVFDTSEDKHIAR